MKSVDNKRKNTEEFLKENFSDLSLSNYFKVLELLGVENEVEKKSKINEQFEKIKKKPNRKKRVLLSTESRISVYRDFEKSGKSSKDIYKLAEKYNVSANVIRSILSSKSIASLYTNSYIESLK